MAVVALIAPLLLRPPLLLRRALLRPTPLRLVSPNVRLLVPPAVLLISTLGPILQEVGVLRRARVVTLRLVLSCLPFPLAVHISINLTIFVIRYVIAVTHRRPSTRSILTTTLPHGSRRQHGSFVSPPHSIFATTNNTGESRKSSQRKRSLMNTNWHVKPSNIRS